PNARPLPGLTCWYSTMVKSPSSSSSAIPGRTSLVLIIPLLSCPRTAARYPSQIPIAANALPTRSVSTWTTTGSPTSSRSTIRSESPSRFLSSLTRSKTLCRSIPSAVTGSPTRVRVSTSVPVPVTPQRSSETAAAATIPSLTATPRREHRQASSCIPTLPASWLFVLHAHRCPAG